jgi:hypothetical protein
MPPMIPLSHPSLTSLTMSQLGDPKQPTKETYNSMEHLQHMDDKNNQLLKTTIPASSMKVNVKINDTEINSYKITKHMSDLLA